MGTYILKRKEFRRDDPVKWITSIYKFAKITINVAYSLRYKKQVAEVGMMIAKASAKKLISDIKKGSLYEDGEHGGDTHYLKDFSKPNEFLTYSKGINSFDRLNYRIYKPTVVDEELVFKVVIDNISGHKVSGKEYSIKTV